MNIDGLINEFFCLAEVSEIPGAQQRMAEIEALIEEETGKKLVDILEAG